MSLAERLGDAARLNNRGAALYAKGEWKESLLLFRQSLEGMIAQLREVAPGNAVADDYSALYLLKKNFDVLPCTGTAESPNKDAESPMVFLNPIVFSSVPTQDQETSLTVICGMIVFNMSIASHAKAMQGDTACLAQALQLYESSVNFIYRTPHAETVFASVLSAALNNKIQIYHSSCRFDELDRDSQRLSKAVYVAYAHEVRDPNSLLSQQDFEGILLNLLLLKRPTKAQAA
ncbi:expressed unknown protein [Seminavis robusta]|uniref:Uncharacterized protein n=1 Tax=Seminavis robusta TaxID=568900 RepID=A0A9N8EFD7_9STRA|nr:expressed unknown protein [Seminavis robusta]|eukprot:Sro911_g219190.1 n/a (233) ;mRNA; r:5776-6474